MTTLKLGRRALMSAAVATMTLGAPAAFADGHQVVLFNHGGERIVFLGDLIPTHHHLNLGVISAFDHSPEKTLEQKRFILEEAEKQGWLLVFSHGHDTKAGYLEKRNSTTYLRPINFE